MNVAHSRNRKAQCHKKLGYIDGGDFISCLKLKDMKHEGNFNFCF